MSLKLFPFILFLHAFFLQLCNGAAISNCIADERNALLDFKKNLIDQQNRLASWEHEDCCNWEGVSCNNVTGHVVRLDLRNTYHNSEFLPSKERSLIGQLSPSLIGLKQLNYFDLSRNYFDGPIPKFVGSLHNLMYLNLSFAGFSGLIPHQLGNLSRLQYLHLDDSFIVDHDARWASHLTSLKHLTMSFTKFGNFQNWMEALNVLPNIAEITLRYCNISSAFPASFPNANFTNLSYLDLSDNYIELESIPLWLFNIKSLTHIDLSWNRFRSIPDALKNLTSLEYINFSWNYFSGTLPDCFEELHKLKTLNIRRNYLSGCIPESFRGLVALKELDLSDNNLNGTVPKSIGQLSNLVRLVLGEPRVQRIFEGGEPDGLGGNKLEGVISEVHFASLTELKELILGSNNLILNISGDWIPPFKLNVIDTGSCKLGPKFPAWLQTQANISYLDMSSSGIEDTLPNWFWDVFATCSFDEPTYLDISNNGIAGTLSILSKLCFSDFHLGNNFFEGSLPPFLNVSFTLDLSNNSFSASIPHTLGALTSLVLLHLGYNNLNGNIPSTLRNCTRLSILDFGMNKLEGIIPIWIGENLTNLNALVLRSNNFIGNIPSNLWKITFLQILDLSNNKLSGRIPQNFGNFTTFGNSFIILGTTQLTIKGRLETYNTLEMLSNQMTNIDLSCNNFSGHIPKELGNLHGLICLNLSVNHLVGSIPSEIGLLHSLESLDLSRNMLSGNIPLSMSTVTMLEFLNLSYNNLSGKIPSGNQLQTFTNEFYIGNPKLCGFPLPKSCDSVIPIPIFEKDPADKVSLLDCWYVSIAPGFVLGFWIVWGTLLLKKKWKDAYFKYVDYMYDAVYVAIAAKIRTARNGG